MNLEKMRQERADAMNRMRALVDEATQADRDLTPEEIAEFDQLKARCETLTRDIELTEVQGYLDEPRPAVAQRQSADPVLFGRFGAPARREFESIGEFMHAVRFSPNDQRLVYQEFEPRGDMRMDSGDSGGFAVPTQFRNDLLQVSPQQAAFRPRAQVLPAGSPPDSAISVPALDQTNGSAPDNMYGGVAVDWLAEGGTKPETDAKLREIKLEPQEVAGYITVTDKLLRNWPAGGPLIERLLQGAVISAEETQFLQGDGVGKPHGIINSAAAYTVSRATATEFNFVDLQAMEARLLMRGGSPVWLLSQSVMPQLSGMRNLTGESPEEGDGALIWRPNARDSNGNQLLGGHPVIWHERSPTLGSKGDVALVDLSYYLIKDGSGPFVAASEHVHFTSNKTVIKIFWNVDGRPWLTGSMTLENGWDASPFVVLDVPAG